jgi:hypothetical protein
VNEYARDEASAWRILLDFWSDMLLYLAPSEKVKGHVDAMARGGEFIMLVTRLGVTPSRRSHYQTWQYARRCYLALLSHRLLFLSQIVEVVIFDVAVLYIPSMRLCFNFLQY